MNAFAKFGSMTILGSSLLLTACAGSVTDSEMTSQTEAASSQTHNDHYATVKPGAAITLSSEIDGTLSVGTYTDIELTLTSGHSAGTLQATAKGTPGLDVLQSNSSLNHDMSTGRAVWRVAVRPQNDGKHYLNIMAITFGGDVQDERARAFSIPLDLGGKTVSDSAEKLNLIEDETGKLIIFEAEETISPSE